MVFLLVCGSVLRRRFWCAFGAGQGRQVGQGGQALAQLQARRSADKYRALGQPIHLIGVEFSKTDRNIVGFEVESA